MVMMSHDTARRSRIQCSLVSVKGRNQDLDLAIGIHRANFPDCFGPVSCATIGQVVSINGSNHRVSKIQVFHFYGNVMRLFRVEIAGFTFSNGAESAMTSADIAAEHERGSAIRPAFEDVRATGFLTNRVKVQTLNKLQHIVLISRVAQLYAEPLGFRLTHFLVIADDRKFAGQLNYLWR